MENDRIRRLLAGGLAAALMPVLGASAAGTAETAETGVPDAAGLGCREMMELWYGGTASLMSGAAPGSPESVVDQWAASREADWSGGARLFGAEDELPASDRVLEERARREDRIRAMQTEQAVEITDAAVSVRIEEGSAVPAEDGTVTFYAYEWTFYDYDDLSDGPGGSDVAGFGTWHKLTLSRLDDGGGWAVASDEYDESDILGIDTIRPATREDPAAARLLVDHMSDPSDTWDEETAPEEETASLMAGDGIEFFEDYDLDAMAAYSDRYCLNYNPAYYNYNPYGGDCANFTSQCIRAGGMPMVYGTPYGTDGWYYRASDDRSGTWTSASRLCAWMGSHRGDEVLATASSVYKGSPCFYNDKHHATICVGYNSAGTPIINSHNSDRYHVKWDYWTPTEIYTVQLTRGPGGPLSISGAEYPTGTLPLGGSFGLRGVITSDDPILSVSAAVYDSAGNAVLSHAQTWASSRYDIRRDGINDAIVFDDLPTGDYTYAVTATDASGVTKTLVSAPFTVGGSTLDLYDPVYPSGTVTKGYGQDLGGTIRSNFALTAVNAYIYDTSDTAVMSYRWEGDGRTKTYDIATGGLDDAFLFGALDIGDYSYAVTAADASGTTKRLLNAPFTVAAGSVELAAPTASVRGSRVGVTWPEVPGATRYTAYLIREPWGWGDTLSPQVVGSPKCTFADVAAGEYRAFYTARLSDGSVQSPWTPLSVGEEILSLTALLDGRPVRLKGNATADVWIGGVLDARGVTGYERALPAGTSYEIREIRPADGLSFDGIASGDRAGAVGTGDPAVVLSLSTIDTADLPKADAAGSFGGNAYQYLSGPMTWWTAARICEALGGHLATVSSEEELAAVSALCGGAPAWLGGSDAEEEDVWTWITGEDLSWTAWMPLEPDDDGGNDEGGEDYLYLTAEGRWGDAAGSRTMGCLCEIEGAGEDPAPGRSWRLRCTGLEIGDGTRSLTASVTASVTAPVSSDTEGPLTGTVHAAAYDGKGRMVSYTILGDVSAGPGETGSVSGSLDLPGEDPGTLTVRLFLLDGDGRPLSDTVVAGRPDDPADA